MNSQSVVICRPTSVSVALDVTCPSFLEAALVAFYDTLWQAQPLMHGVILTLLLCTGIRNAELLQFRLTDIDLHSFQVRVTQGKGHQVLMPAAPAPPRLDNVDDCAILIWTFCHMDTRQSVAKHVSSSIHPLQHRDP